MKKLIIIILFVIMTLSLSGLHFAEVEASSIYITKSSDSNITVYADVIEYKYREYNGRLQYRRWNRTKNRWVDPYWIYA